MNLLRVFYFENTKPWKIKKLERLGECVHTLAYLAGGKRQERTAENKSNVNRTVDTAKWSKNKREFLQNHRKAKHELVCLQGVSGKLRDTQYDSFAHISWFKTRKLVTRIWLQFSKHGSYNKCKHSQHGDFVIEYINVIVPMQVHTRNSLVWY